MLIINLQRKIEWVKNKMFAELSIIKLLLIWQG